MQGISSTPSPVTQQTESVSEPKVESGRETSFATIASHPLRMSFSFALRSRSFVYAAKPTTIRSPLMRDMSARISAVFRNGIDVSSPSALLSFSGATFAGV